MADQTDLQTTVSEVLEATVALLAQTSGGPVDRAYVSPGEPALDCCPQLTVHVDSIGEAETVSGSPLSPGIRYRTGRQTLATILITLARCIPIPKADEVLAPAVLEAAAAVVNEDAWMVWTQLYRQQQDGSLFGLCDEVFFDALAPLAPQGGCAGWVMQVRVAIPGFRLGGS